MIRAAAKEELAVDVPSSPGLLVEFNQQCIDYLKKNHPGRCIFTNILQFKESNAPINSNGRARLRQTCHCVVHERECPITAGSSDIMNVSGPPCVLFSKPCPSLWVKLWVQPMNTSLLANVGSKISRALL